MAALYMAGKEDEDEAGGMLSSVSDEEARPPCPGDGGWNPAAAAA